MPELLTANWKDKRKWGEAGQNSGSSGDGRMTENLVRTFARLAKDEVGTTSIEYALIGTLVSVAILVGAIALGDQLGAMYSDLASKFK